MRSTQPTSSQSEDDRPIAEDILTTLWAVFELSRVHINRMQREQGHHLSMLEAQALQFLLTREEATLGDLSKDSNIAKGSWSHVLKRLRNRELVETRIDPANGRHQTLRLTNAGVDAVRFERASGQRVASLAARGLPEGDRIRLQIMLRQLHDSLSEDLD